jgi:hypothetical protein
MLRMERSIAALSGALLIGSLSNAAPATELIVNGGFESGDLSGWISANASVESAHLGVIPHSGSYMAVMGVGGSGLPLPDDDALLLQTISFDTGAVSAVEVSFAYNMQALDFSPAVDFGTDALVVALIPIAAPAAALPLLTVPFNDEFDGLVPEMLGWTTFSETVSSIPDIGVVNLSFTFFLQNTMALILNGDEGQLFAAYIDDVSFRTVPEPTALMLFSIGLAVLGLGKRLSRSASWPGFSGARRPTSATARS